MLNIFLFYYCILTIFISEVKNKKKKRIFLETKI